MEYLNLYDKSGILINKKGIRGEKTEYLVGIVLVFMENSKGEFLIQKTSSLRDSVFATTGGHVSYGTDFLETAINEIKEELGIDISKKELVEVNTYIRERFVQKVYYLKKDVDIKDITIQESEVDYVKWLTKDEINEIIKNNKFRESHIAGYKYIVDNINNS